MERVAADPWARKRVMFDILNEPDARDMHVSVSWIAVRKFAISTQLSAASSQLLRPQARHVRNPERAQCETCM